MRSGLVRFMLPTAAALAVVAALACSSGNNSSSNGGNATNNGAPSVATVVTTAVPRANLGSPAAAATLDEVTTDNKFSQTKYTVKAGVPVTLTLSNKGQAVHNWQLTDVKDDAGKEIKTDLVNGGKSASITFSISKPGTYHFRC